MGASQQIPLFELFGEQGGGSDAEFIHLEDIESRSSLYNWEITPHAHGHLFQSVIVQAGEVRVGIDGGRVRVRGPVAVLLPPGIVHQFQFSPGTLGHVLTVAQSVLIGAAPPQSRPLFDGLAAQARVVRLDRDPAALSRIIALIGQLEDEFRHGAPGRTLMFDWLVRAILLLVARTLPHDDLALADPRHQRVFNRFRHLVEEHFREQWPVSRYAERLGITEGQLNRICRRCAGQSTQEIVRDRLMLEARRRLVYIAAPVSRIAYELGFEDPSYFCRFFRKHSGLSPAQFRRDALSGL